jgi:hypothetical protein
MPNLADRRSSSAAPEIFHVPQDTLDQLMAAAYLLHSDGHYLHAEMVCRGMLAAEPDYWYAAALLQATLEKRAHGVRRGPPRARKSSHRCGRKEGS